MKSRCRLPLEDADGASDDIFGCEDDVKVCHLDESNEEWNHIKGTL